MIFGVSRLLVVASLAIFVTGCGGSNEFRELGDADDVTNTDPMDAHHHHDEGPHGGHVLEFGDFHGEIVYSDGIVSLYLLGDDAQTPEPVEMGEATLHLGEGEDSTVITLQESPLEGESDGQSSRFVSEAGQVPAEIKDIEDITGNVELIVGEKTLTAIISHDHDHGHDEEHAH